MSSSRNKLGAAGKKEALLKVFPDRVKIQHGKIFPINV